MKDGSVDILSFGSTMVSAPETQAYEYLIVSCPEAFHFRLAVDLQQRHRLITDPSKL